MSAARSGGIPTVRQQSLRSPRKLFLSSICAPAIDAESCLRTPAVDAGGLHSSAIHPSGGHSATVDASGLDAPAVHSGGSHSTTIDAGGLDATAVHSSGGQSTTVTASKHKDNAN